MSTPPPLNFPHRKDSLPPFPIPKDISAPASQPPRLLTRPWPLSLSLCLLLRAGAAGKYIFAIGCACAIAAQVCLNWEAMDQHDNHYVWNYGSMHLEKLPVDSVLVVKGDVITNSIRCE